MVCVLKRAVGGGVAEVGLVSVVREGVAFFEADVTLFTYASSTPWKRRFPVRTAAALHRLDN